MGRAGYKVEFHMGGRGGLMKNWEKKNGGEEGQNFKHDYEVNQ